MSFPMRIVPGSVAELSRSPATGPRVLATVAGPSGTGTATLRVESDTATGESPVAVWSAGPAAEQVFKARGGQPSAAERAPRINPQADEKREFYKSAPPADGASVTSAVPRAGDSSEGPQVVFAPDRYGMLIDLHAGGDPTAIDELARRPGAPLYSPGEAGGCDKALDHIGDIQPGPIRFDGPAPVKPNEVECGRVVYTDAVNKAIDPHAPVRVRGLLWAGTARLRGDQFTKDKFKSLKSWNADFGKGPIDAARVHEKVEVHFPGVSEPKPYIERPNPLPPAADRDALHGRITVEARVWNGKLLVWLYVTLGEVVGTRTVDAATLGKTVLQNGHRSGPTVGTLYAFDARVDRLPYRPGLSASFGGWFLVRGTSPSAPFSRPGDSNASVYLPDQENPARLYTLGMITAGLAVHEQQPPGAKPVPEIVTLAQPIEPALKAHGATLRTVRPKK